MQLVINAGSSTLKWALFSDNSSGKKNLEGAFEGFGRTCKFTFAHRQERIPIHNHQEATDYLIRFLEQNQVLKEPIHSCVHRVVHGGEKYHEPVVINQQVLADIQALSILAPLHNPANLAGIRSCILALPETTQIAVFDTAFHTSISKEVFLYGIPYELYEKHKIRKYGFHGISHSYIAHILKEKGITNLLSCHIGSGASITAIRQGRSADTTMGFTPLDGLMMATRSGDLDPEIPIFLLRNEHYSLDQLDELLSKRSGLLGVTGHKDMREIWKLAQEGDKQCQLGLDMLAYRIAYFVNALRTAVPYPQALVFTAGIGEKAWYVRAAVCKLLQLPLDEEKNQRNEEIISHDKSPIPVLVVKTDEQLQMHRLASHLLP